MIWRCIMMPLLFALGAMPLFAAQPPATLRIQEKQADVFGKTKAVYHVVVSAREAMQGRVTWQFAVGGATVARNEQAVDLAPAREARVEISLEIPAVKDGVIFDAKLTIGLLDAKADKPLATLDKDLWIFPEDAFYLKNEALAAAKIHLFNPEKKTAKLLEDAKVPFEPVDNLDSISDLKEGLLVIGEGVSFKDYRGLGEMLVKTAARGIPVLCLLPDGGEMTLPGAGDVDLPRPKNMRFASNGIITSMDKRLDAESWSPDGKVMDGGMKLRGDRGPVVAETAKDGAWPWVELNYAGKGRLVICGFGFVENWKAEPAPRFFLAKLLEYMTENTKR